MSSKFDRAIEVVLEHEGGYVNHGRDPGGATNFGISLRYARSRGSMFDLDGDGDVDANDIKLVTKENAKVVYRNWFWADVRGDELPPGVDLAVVDYAVNSGSGRAIKALQAAVGVDVDGVMGPKTMAAVKAADPAKVVREVCRGRLAFLQGLNTWDTFGRGWTRRVQDVQDRALEMVGAPLMTVREAASTSTVTATAGTATVVTLAGAVAQAEPVVKALGGLNPWVAVALVVVAVVAGVLMWRKGKG